MLPEKWVISKIKKVIAPLAVKNYAFRHQINWIEVALERNTALYICFAVTKRGPRAG